jgi:hypothetical protein
MHGIGSSFCRDASKENRGPLVRQDAGKAGRIALARSAHAMKAFRGLSKRNACPCFSFCFSSSNGHWARRRRQQ